MVHHADLDYRRKQGLVFGATAVGETPAPAMQAVGRPQGPTTDSPPAMLSAVRDILSAHLNVLRHANEKLDSLRDRIGGPFRCNEASVASAQVPMPTDAFVHIDVLQQEIGAALAKAHEHIDALSRIA